MQTEQVVMGRAEARDLYRAYKKHLHYSEPIDREVMRAYQLLAQGRLVIKALASMIAAGLDDKSHPKLAIACATAKSCSCSIGANGSAVFDSRTVQSYKRDNGKDWQTERAFFRFPHGSFTVPREVWSMRAQVPLVPIDKRPQRGLANYHILWEAEWTKVVPRDPFLLRRIGNADLWTVVAMWDLSEVERAALATRL
jgi:hypothetical protein